MLMRARPKRNFNAICLIAICVMTLTACAPDAGDAKAPPESVAANLLASQCGVLAGRVDAVPGSAPLLLRSYDAPTSANVANDDALRTAAFSYDNALAVIALSVCGKPAQARRVAEALRLASMGDRLRNAYREGVVESSPLPNGWWSESESRWIEDAYQMGTATGNVAWVALAMLTIAAEDNDPGWLAAALRLGNWVIRHARDASVAGGFNGGLHGFDGAEQTLAWKSTEHNTDLAALFSLLAAQDDSVAWSRYHDEALAFVAAQWDEGEGRFRVGTLPDGQTNHSSSGLDALLWPLLLRDAQPDWKRSMDYAIRHHGVGAGFDFNSDRDGIWTEGTAQAALVLAALGRQREADLSLQEVALRERAVSSASYLPATDRERISTGLAVSPDSKSADFYYYQRPHLAASAWAVIAAARWNPFTLRQTGSATKPEALSQ